MSVDVDIFAHCSVQVYGILVLQSDSTNELSGFFARLLSPSDGNKTLE